MESKLYILDWGNEMIGIFRGSDLSQVDNGSKNYFFDSLEHVMNLYDLKNCEIEILKSREELQELRDKLWLEKKPTLDEYLLNMNSHE